MRPRLPLHRVHYAPGKGDTRLTWCGRTGGFHTALPTTADLARVTCGNCRRVLARMAREQASEPKPVR